MLLENLVEKLAKSQLLPSIKNSHNAKNSFPPAHCPEVKAEKKTGSAKRSTKKKGFFYSNHQILHVHTNICEKYEK